MQIQSKRVLNFSEQFCHSERSRGISGYFGRPQPSRDVSTSLDMTSVMAGRGLLQLLRLALRSPRFGVLLQPFPETIEFLVPFNLDLIELGGI